MKTIFKNSTLIALGIVAVALLTSAHLIPARAVASTTITLKTVSVPSVLLLAGKDDGQESHGGKTKG